MVLQYSCGGFDCPHGEDPVTYSAWLEYVTRLVVLSVVFLCAKCGVCVSM